MGADRNTSNEREHDPASVLAGTILELISVPDGDIRERLLDVANPYRGEINRIVRKSDPEDERKEIRRHFKAVNTQYVHPDDARELIDRCLNGDDRSTFTAQHDHTVEALETLRADLNPEPQSPQWDDVPQWDDDIPQPGTAVPGHTIAPDQPEESDDYPDEFGVEYDATEDGSTLDPAELEAFRAWQAQSKTDDTDTKDTSS